MNAAQRGETTYQRECVQIHIDILDMRYNTEHRIVLPAKPGKDSNGKYHRTDYSGLYLHGTCGAPQGIPKRACGPGGSKRMNLFVQDPMECVNAALADPDCNGSEIMYTPDWWYSWGKWIALAYI